MTEAEASSAEAETADAARDGTGVGDGAGRIEPDGYAAAMAELEELLDELERSDVDVDRLARRVARGAELIRYCRDRLDVVDRDVAAVVSDLLTSEPGVGGPDEGR